MTNEQGARPAGPAQNAQLIASFSAHLHGVRAPGTRKKYVHAVSELAGWAGDRSLTELKTVDLNGFTAEFIESFHKRNGREPARATTRNRLIAVRAFYAYLDRNDLLSTKNPADQLELPKNEPKDIDYLSVAEDQALLAAPQTPEERIIISLLRWTGVRVDEARNILISDIHLTPGTERVVIRVSKSGSGKRTIPLAPELIPQLQRWLSYLAECDRWKSELPLLSTRTGKPMAAQYIWRVVKRVAYNADVRRIECSCGSNAKTFHKYGCAQSSTGENRSSISDHTLRRTFATDAINRGVRIETLAKLIGHSSSRTTEKYYAQVSGATVKNEWFAAMGWS